MKTQIIAGVALLMSTSGLASHSSRPSFENCMRESVCLSKLQCKPLQGTQAISVAPGSELRDRTLLVASTRLISTLRDAWVCPNADGSLTRFETDRMANVEHVSEARYVNGRFTEAEDVPADVYLPVLELATVKCAAQASGKLDIIPACSAQ